MNEEKHYQDHFARDLVVKILLLGLGVFLILWLMPKPEKATTNVNVNLDPLLNQIFNQNIQTLKSTAKAYYTVERMPKEYNEKKSMTLGEMLDKHLLLPLIDKNNKECSRTNSYVEVTKQENDEYMLKVNLSCSDRTEYIIEYIGCYDFCKELSCGKVLRAVSSSPKAVPANGKIDKPVDHKERTEYEYYKDIKASAWSPYGEWMNEFKQETATLKRQERELVRAKVWVAKPVFLYEYQRNVAYYTDWSAWTDWTTVYKDTSHVIDREARTVTGNPVYGAWNNTQEYRSKTTMQTYENETERLFQTGTDQERVCTEDKAECYEYITYYLYRKQNRTKTIPTQVQYRYRTRSYNTYTETVWSYNSPANTCEAGKSCSGWVATGNKKQTSDKGQWIYTGWIYRNQVPSGYTVFDTKMEYRYSVYSEVTERKYVWSEKTAIDGWTRTGRTRTETIK